ncbi:hypothetical protein G5V59_17120 [Nocardioides sp. W3-2-3]|uniref:hypothetical protein n=1 Tax=Nocardioides convexus TaxID=2712224 RepID=UPI002418B563|nr:hypothetical protein [Nocardioides convexus]NHA01018.1 hypothetical protein [Nocardioides convexus]
MTTFQPFDALTATLPLAADFGVPVSTDAVLQALDDLTGGAAQYPFVPRTSGPETVLFSAAERIAVRGEEGALLRALVVAWFAGTAVTVHTDRPERWERVAEAGRALAVPGLEVRPTDEAGPEVLTFEAPLRWADLGFAPWARALLHAEVVPGGHEQYRAPHAEESVAARFRFLVEQVRRDPGFRPVPPAEGTGFPVQSKADLEAMTVAGGYDGQVLRSGASTGRPRYIAYSRGDWQRMVAEAVPMLYAVGLQPGDRVVNTLFGGSLYGGLTTSLCELVPDERPQLHHRPARHPGRAWSTCGAASRSTPSSACPPCCSRCCATPPRSSRSLRIPTIVFGGSPLAEHDRDWLADHLGTRTISSILAANDGAQIAYQCPHQRGRTHHLVDDYNLVEVVDEEDRPVPDGVPGHILLTTLQKPAPAPGPLPHRRPGRARPDHLCVRGERAHPGVPRPRRRRRQGQGAHVRPRRGARRVCSPSASPSLQVVVDTVDGTESVLVRAESAAKVEAEQAAQAPVRPLRGVRRARPLRGGPRRVPFRGRGARTGHLGAQPGQREGAPGPRQPGRGRPARAGAAPPGAGRRAADRRRRRLPAQPLRPARRRG